MHRIRSIQFGMQRLHLATGKRLDIVKTSGLEKIERGFFDFVNVVEIHRVNIFNLLFYPTSSALQAVMPTLPASRRAG
jgi:hypothetical protein